MKIDDMSTEKEQATSAKVDGRMQRSERSREAIIKAMLDLVEEGNLVPTAQQIADSAGVGIRSVFRHFEDMESMFDVANELTWPKTQDLFVGGDREGTLSQRILHATERHANAFETLKNIMLSTQARRWHSSTLRKNYARAQRGLRKDLNNWLPELATLSTNRREAVDAAASFENWHRLREHQGLSKKTSIDVVVEMLELLIC
jgi:AcrR family transcriptional regulator